ncbi:MAG: divergent PAP2 family protein [Lachnospiraceae bacterium]|nr:divergent PAP2 family protein [Lachnospiraceae bacterium]
MNFLSDLLDNHVLMTAIIAWFVASVIKTLIHAFLNQEFSLERMVGSGGMPSSHSATVCALALATAFDYGVSGFPFAIAVMFAIIVMHDARGVRQEAGKQAKVLHQLIEELAAEDLTKGIPVDNLKEFVGHTPLQVLMGALLGLVVAAILYATVY